MSSTWKNKLEITIFGESHGQGLGIVLGNLPAGIKLDTDFIKSELKRRAPGQNIISTPRKEEDKFTIMSGIQDGITTGAPLMAFIANTDQHSKDYSLLKEKMRPSHSDYPAFIKYKGFNDIRGGGHFSGRITAPLVIAGAIAKQILKKNNIEIVSHIKSIKNIKDQELPLDISQELIKNLQKQEYPLVNQKIYAKMFEVINDARKDLNSVGGKVECAVVGLKPGIGDPFFDSIESHISSLLFSIPGLKSVAFGNENISELYASQANDQYYYDSNYQIKTKTNNNGGILGGITTGMPLVFTVGFKPTSSIARKQETINIVTKENTEIEIHGRHDPCIVLRAAVVVEAVSALAILDYILYDERFK